MGVYIWLSQNAPGARIVAMGQAAGPVIPPPQPNRVRVSRLRATPAAGTVPGPYVNPRDALTIGTYNPAEYVIPGHGLAVGVLPDVARTDYAGNFTATANGQVIENLNIFGQVRLGSFSNVVIRNCTVYGPANTSANWRTLTAPIVGNNGNLRNCLVVDSHIRGVGNFWVCAMRDGGYTLRRVEITNHQDGISLTSTVGNVTVEGCWNHNGLYAEFSQTEVDSGEHPPGGNFYTHVDGVQFHVGKNYTFRGNMIGGLREPWDIHLGHEADINSGDDHYNACFMIKQEVSTAEANFLDNIIIENNYLWGGASTINITTPAGTAAGPKNYLTPKAAEGGRPARVGCIIRNNTFLPSTWDDKLKTRINSAGTGVMDRNGQAYVLRDQNVGVFQNNTFPDGAPVPIRAGGNYVDPNFP